MDISILIYAVIALVVFVLIIMLIPSNKNEKKDKSKTSRFRFIIHTEHKNLVYRNPFVGFLVYGGASSGKTKSIGKQLLREYIRHGFAGLIYDYKDFDLTKTANHLVKKQGYPYSFYYISFVDMNRTHRVNPISPSVIRDENSFIQIISDLLDAQLLESKRDEWYNGALGILKGVAIRFYNEYPQFCTVPHLVNYICSAGRERVLNFLKGSSSSRTLASAFIDAEGSERTQASYLSTLTNYLSGLAFNKNVAYVLSGDDFDFNLIEPLSPKLISIANSYSIESLISPVISMMVSISARQFNMENRVPFFYFMDEATTFKINEFEKMPSVLREYNCSFTLLTQSAAKIEKLYGKLDRSSIEANLANQFYGRTKDTMALQAYQLVFGKQNKQYISKTKGSTQTGKSTSTTVSDRKEEVYDTNFFTNLRAGQFVGSTSEANIRDFNFQFKMYQDEEEELPVVRMVLPIDIENNFNRILLEVEQVS